MTVGHDTIKGSNAAVSCLDKGTRERLTVVIANWDEGKGSLISLLQRIDAEANYVPPETLPAVADKLQLPLSQVCSVATFYRSVSLSPRGRHRVTCCVGTACHVRGGDRVANEIATQLGIEPGETTPDLAFSFETVNCLGACALGPVVVIDGKYHARMTSAKVRSLLQQVKRESSTDA